MGAVTLEIQEEREFGARRRLLASQLLVPDQWCMLTTPGRVVLTDDIGIPDTAGESARQRCDAEGSGAAFEN